MQHLDPALHVIAGSLGRGHRGAQLSSRDHRRSTFLRVGFVHLSLFFFSKYWRTLTHLHNWDELVLDPGVVVDQTDHRLAVDCCVESIRELGSMDISSQWVESFFQLANIWQSH